MDGYNGDQLRVLSDVCEGAVAVGLDAYRIVPGSVMSSDFTHCDDYPVAPARVNWPTPSSSLTLVHTMHSLLTRCLVAATDHGRGLAVLAANPDLSIAGPGAALTRCAAEAAGRLTFLAERDTPLHVRLGRTLAMEQLDRNERSRSGPVPEQHAAEKAEWRDLGRRLGFELGPKQNFDAYAIQSTAAIELGLGWTGDQRVIAVLRSFTSAGTHSYSTAMEVEPVKSQSGTVRRQLRDSDRRGLFLWATAGSVLLAASSYAVWSSLDPNDYDLTRRWEELSTVVE